MKRRGVVLPVTLILVASAVLVVASMVAAAGSAASASRLAAMRSQARAAALSGIDAALHRLSEQRRMMLEGKTPEIEREIEIGPTSGSSRVMARVVELDDLGTVLAAEATRINVNTATSDMLIALNGDNAAISSIIAQSAATPFSSVSEVALVDGAGAWLESGSQTSDARVLDSLTVFAFDPCVRAGASSPDASDAGQPRIVVRTSWPDDFAAVFRGRWGDVAAGHAERLAKTPLATPTMSGVVGAMRSAGVPKELWRAILDLVTTSESSMSVGLVDVNRAPASVLAAIPGIGAPLASAIVAARERLSDDSRMSISWLVDQDVLTADQFEAAAASLTSRTLQWRVRMTGSVEITDADGEGRTVASSTYEAVIDCSESIARIAELRDVTFADLRISVAGQSENRTRLGPDIGLSQDAGLELGAATGFESMEMETDLDLGGLDLGGLELESLEIEAFDPSSGISGDRGVDGVVETGPPTSETVGAVERAMRVGRWTSGRPSGR